MPASRPHLAAEAQLRAAEQALSLQRAGSRTEDIALAEAQLATAVAQRDKAHTDLVDATIDALNNLGKVQSEHITGQDVSAQYVDLKARLANEEAQRDAMLALLAQAHNINDIITVQNQLGQITQQIEQLKGQINYLDHNTTFSTIAVTIVEAGAPVQTTATDSWGFATALSDAAHNFVSTVNYVVSGLGAIGPVVILLGLGYLVWRRRGSPGLKRA